MHAAPAIDLLDLDAVWAALAEVPDPEIPTISIVDLGIVRTVALDDARLRIELLPTFVGCPALDMIRAAVEDRLAGIRPTVEVSFTFAEPWTTDRITDRGRRGLRAGGCAPPTARGPSRDDSSIVPLDVAVPCPICGSRRTRLDHGFGPPLRRPLRSVLTRPPPTRA